MDLSGALAKVHALVRDVAPLPDDDDQDRLRRARAWIALGEELRKASKQIEPAAQHLWTANSGADVGAFQAMWHGEDGPSRKLAAGAGAAELTGVGTMVVVVVRVAWKAVVIYLLVVLAVSLVRALIAGPAGYVLWAARLVGVRQALRTLLLQARRHVGEVVVGTLVRARATLTGLFMSIPAVPVAAAATKYYVKYGLEPSDEEARRNTEEELARTPAGREALAWVRDHDVTVLFLKSEVGDLAGGFSAAGDFNDSLNVLRIGSADTSSVASLAETYVHEVNHARHQNAPDALRMGREEFINAGLDEEVEGDVKAHELARQSADLRGTELIDSYGSSYDRAIADAQDARRAAGQPPLTNEEAHGIGDRAGRAALREKFVAAGYAENLGKQWDRRWLTFAEDTLM